MTLPSCRSTQVSQFVKAPREVVYQAFIDPDAVSQWLAPDTMRGHVEILEPYLGGKLRMSLIYVDQHDRPRGKTFDDTDISERTFIEVIPNEKLVEVVEFESDQPDMAGEMKITWSLADVEGGTEVTVLMQDIPKGVRLEDNELGSKQSLRKLASLIESGWQGENHHAI